MKENRYTLTMDQVMAFKDMVSLGMVSELLNAPDVVDCIDNFQSASSLAAKAQEARNA